MTTGRGPGGIKKEGWSEKKYRGDRTTKVCTILRSLREGVIFLTRVSSPRVGGEWGGVGNARGDGDVVTVLRANFGRS